MITHKAIQGKEPNTEDTLTINGLNMLFNLFIHKLNILYYMIIDIIVILKLYLIFLQKLVYWIY